ncbi:MAG: hypothetical protein IJX95_02775 [Lachnospiraceae bacterium]|nr:hypothetical protein [Lachnospiraceae bacterium]
MHHPFEKLTTILTIVLYLIALLFILYGFVKVYRGEPALVYFLLGGCFCIISTGKKIWDKRA